ncbi:hypothetical protein SAMN05661080_01313 [Modestobacter sp. DSM 44400]|nr:hypothetical protein SAMN05661080_01313 [Modestobacter sp. DSM 44400]
MAPQGPGHRPSGAHNAGRQGAAYRPQFRDPSGRQVTKGFALKRDAQRWLTDQTAHIVRGTYGDPGAGRTTFAEFYADWSSRQV